MNEFFIGFLWSWSLLNREEEEEKMEEIQFYLSVVVVFCSWIEIDFFENYSFVSLFSFCTLILVKKENTSLYTVLF